MAAGGIKADRALNYSFTGPNLRAAGVDYDVRVAKPYSSYEDFDFTIPVGLNGDVYDRFMVRQEEMWQSLNIIKQAMDKLPEGPFHAEVPEFYLLPKRKFRITWKPHLSIQDCDGETDVPKGEVISLRGRW